MASPHHPLARLIESFQQLPGVGPKSAQRLAFHILKQSPAQVDRFIETVIETRAQIRECERCFNWSNQSPCEICTHPNREGSILAVVAQPQDLFALERSGEFQGHYHVLHGLISPMNGVGPDDLKIRWLMDRLHRRAAQDEPSQDEALSGREMQFKVSSLPVVQEVVLALPPSVEGDTTSLYLSRLIQPLGLKLTRIAFGLPVGGDLDYADSLTIARALAGRQQF